LAVNGGHPEVSFLSHKKIIQATLAVETNRLPQRRRERRAKHRRDGPRWINDLAIFGLARPGSQVAEKPVDIGVLHSPPPKPIEPGTPFGTVSGRCDVDTQTASNPPHCGDVKPSPVGVAASLVVEVRPEPKPPCDECEGTDVVGFGKRPTRQGLVQLYRCKRCGKRFTGNLGFQKRRSDPAKIATALDLYYRGLSFREVADHLHQSHALPVSQMTVYRWVTHYGSLVAEWMNRQGARVGAQWHVDETVVQVDGVGAYWWNVLDYKTRFLLATHLSRNRSLSNTRTPLRKAKQATTDRPLDVFTDGMMAYPKAVRKEFAGISGPGTNGFHSPHRRVPSIRAKVSNNVVERLHGSEKGRVKVMRGFDNCPSAFKLMEGWRAHYNLVRAHQALGTTPAVAAGFPPLEGFKWLTVLKRAVLVPMGRRAGRPRKSRRMPIEQASLSPAPP
jgi:putative transposase